MALLFAMAFSINSERKEKEDGKIEENVARFLSEKVTENAIPFFSFASRTKGQASMSFVEEMLMDEFPIMVQASTLATQNPWMEDVEQANATQENASKEKTEDGEKKPDFGEIDHMLADMLEENRAKGGQVPEDATVTEKEENVPDIHNEMDLESGFLEENRQQSSGFLKHGKVNEIDLSALSDYQNLVSAFYTIDGGTAAGSNQLDAETFLAKDMTISKDDPGPQILIYHTHSLEAFADSEPGNREHTIVGVGDRLTEILTQEYGYSVLHHTQEYDTDRSDAYANSLPGITKVLEDNPSIQVVIDLHRDAGVKGVKRAIDLDGRPTATFMLFNGMSRTRKNGAINYLYNPNLEDNLAFSFQMHLKAGEYYPGLTRKIYLKAYRYNMHLKPRTLLIELGDSNNTVEEAMNTCDPLAHILDMVLSGEDR